MNDKNFRELILSMQEAGHLVGTGKFVDKSTPIILNALNRKGTALSSFQSFEKGSEKDRYKETNIKNDIKANTSDLVLDEKLIQSDSDEAFKKNV